MWAEQIDKKKKTFVLFVCPSLAHPLLLFLFPPPFYHKKATPRMPQKIKSKDTWLARMTKMPSFNSLDILEALMDALVKKRYANSTM
jgi:hypothetical protein